MVEICYKEQRWHSPEGTTKPKRKNRVRRPGQNRKLNITLITVLFPSQPPHPSASQTKVRDNVHPSVKIIQYGRKSLYIYACFPPSGPTQLFYKNWQAISFRLCHTPPQPRPPRLGSASAHPWSFGGRMLPLSTSFSNTLTHIQMSCFVDWFVEHFHS